MMKIINLKTMKEFSKKLSNNKMKLQNKIRKSLMKEELMLLTPFKNNLKISSINSIKEPPSKITQKASLINQSSIKSMPLQTKLKDKTNYLFNI